MGYGEKTIDEGDISDGGMSKCFNVFLSLVVVVKCVVKPESSKRNVLLRGTSLWNNFS